MKDILEQIVIDKRTEVQMQKTAVAENYLAQEAEGIFRQPISMKAALADSDSGIIAEFKRKSPSKGWIKESGNPEIIPPSYEKNGASALSILTDEKYFGGRLDFIKTVRPLVNLPILRKDFIIDEYQLYQARVVGADSVLLIAACLTIDECLNLARKAHGLHLEVLLEVHSEKELAYVNEYVDMVGVNNRNLGTFHTNVENSFNLAALLPKNVLLVSESGISNTETIRRLREVGFRGFLIGESFMKTDNPGAALNVFVKELTA